MFTCLKWHVAYPEIVQTRLPVCWLFLHCRDHTFLLQQVVILAVMARRVLSLPDTTMT